MFASLLVLAAAVALPTMIDGLKNPEKIPDAVAWEAALTDLAKIADSRHDAAEGIAKYTLFMSAEHFRIVLSTMAAARTKAGNIREASSHGNLKTTLAQRAAVEAGANVEILEARDALKRTLPPRSFRALARHVEKAENGHVSPSRIEVNG